MPINAQTPDIMKNFLKSQSLLSLTGVSMLASKKSILFPTTFSLALALGIVTIPRMPTLAESQSISLGNSQIGFNIASVPFEPPVAKLPTDMITAGAGARIFEPPPGGATPSTAGGGTRGGSCLSKGKSIIPLMPSNNSVFTVSGYPTFYSYIPESTAQTARFVLREQDRDEPLYETTFDIPSTPGIVSVSLPQDTLPPLKVGKNYRWFLVVVCDTEDSSKNAVAQGWIRRIKPSAALATEIEKTSESEVWRVYGKAGVWQETLMTLAQLRRSHPGDSDITADWEKLLNEVGLSAIAKDPLIDCCTVNN